MKHTQIPVAAMYADLFASLSAWSKQQLIDALAKDLRENSDAEKQAIDTAFYNSFGAFADDKTAEELIAEIKTSRQFRDKPLKF